MITKVNDNSTFKAKLITSLRPADKKRLIKISQMFEEGTKKYPNEALYLTRGKYSGVMSIHTNNTKTGEFIYQGEEIFTTSLNEHLETLTDEQIAKKLIKAFKVLRLSDSVAALKEEINSTKEKLYSNLKIAKNLRAIGRENFAEKYDVLASLSRKKLNNLMAKLDTLKYNFNKQRNSATEEFPEIGQVEI